MLKTEKSNITGIGWACRRGMLELDLVLAPFFEQCFNELTSRHQAQFVQLLSFQDQLLYNWLIIAKAPEKAMQEIVTLIKNHAQRKN